MEITQQAVNLILQESAKLPELIKPSALHQTDFDAPLYNVWRQQEKTPGSGDYGNWRGYPVALPARAQVPAGNHVPSPVASTWGRFLTAQYVIKMAGPVPQRVH